MKTFSIRTEMRRTKLYTAQLTAGGAHPSMQSQPNRRYITGSTVDFYNAIGRYQSELAEFQRPIEFYGRIRHGIDDQRYLIVTVDPMLGTRELASSSTACLVSRRGESEFEPLFIDSREDLPDGRIRLTLGKPGNIEDEEIGPLNGKKLITTNCNSVPWKRKILANYDAETVTVYQAYSPVIGNQALEQQNFGDRFDPTRRTWVKPSFGWMMHRSDWSRKKGQEVVLAIQLMRSTFDRLLELSCLTNPTLGVFYKNEAEYQVAKRKRPNFVQWDPDRRIDGKRRQARALQLGIDPAYQNFYKDGIVKIEDISDLARQVLRLRDAENPKFLELLPIEAPYPTPLHVLRPLEAHQYFTDESPQLMQDIVSMIE